MSVTRPRVTEKEQYFSEIDRLVNSQVLHGSEQLCKLLRYLGEHALEKPGSPLKEYQIATEVFGRPADFDPQLDSAIRVQAGRLRLKLAEYYASEGSGDPIQLEMPKGTYLISFHARVVEPSKIHLQAPLEPAGPAAIPMPRKWVVAVVSLSFLLILAIAAIVYLAVGQRSAGVAAGATPQAGPLATFWRPFVTGTEEPWVIFSNAA